MWFASLTTADRIPWFSRFLETVLRGNQDVLDLLDSNPFHNDPPKYVRALYYEYTFTDPETREANNQWWERKPKNLYFPAASIPDEK